MNWNLPKFFIIVKGAALSKIREEGAVDQGRVGKFERSAILTAALTNFLLNLVKFINVIKRRLATKHANKTKFA